MKALLKIGFVAALCLAGNAAFGQTTQTVPLPKGANVKTAPAPTEKTAEPATAATPQPERKKGQKMSAPATQREKKIEPAKKEDIR